MMIIGALNVKTEQQNHIDANNEMLNRIGQLTRALHENLRGIGLEKIVEKISKDIPDACERLQYVSRMTEQSAERVLNATDAAGLFFGKFGDTHQLFFPLLNQRNHVINSVQKCRYDGCIKVFSTLRFKVRQSFIHGPGFFIRAFIG